jgi:hypothetical protein
MDLNKHIVTNDSELPFHSNGYARVANGDRLGATAAESFGMRRQIDASRQIIKGYHRSSIGSAYGAQRAKPVDTGLPTSTYSINNRPVSGPRYTSAPRRFSEPKPQTYNPYS